MHPAALGILEGLSHEELPQPFVFAALLPVVPSPRGDVRARAIGRSRATARRNWIMLPV
jgi:hypothetical protein